LASRPAALTPILSVRTLVLKTGEGHDGIVRARYRDLQSEATLIEPGKIYRYEIDLWATSNLFLKGHQIRVEISSSNFPRFDRNPNTGHAFGADAQMQTATQTIYHDSAHPSHIVLLVIPQEVD
jgi:hypothetical protein